MPPLSGKQRKAQLKLKRAIKRGERHPEQHHQRKNKPTAAKAKHKLESHFVRLDKRFLDDSRALASSIALTRPIQCDVAVLPESQLVQLTVPKRPRWRYQMSKDELDANEHACFRTWLTQQDAIIEQWQRASHVPPPSDQTDDSETRLMPHPPTHFERNIEVWRQFWRVTEISQILLVLLDSRCPPLHLPSSLSVYLNIPTVSHQSDSSPRPRRSASPRIILVLTKVDISGPARTASWTSFLDLNYPGVPVVPVEAYAQKRSFAVKQGPTRFEPHLPGSFRERLVGTLQDVHEQLLQPPQWVTAARAGESEEQRLERIDRWKPRVKRVINWDGVLEAKGKLVGKAVGGSTRQRGQDIDDGPEITDADEDVSEQEQLGDVYEWKEPEFLTVGLVGQPNVGKSSLLNAIFGTTRARASRTPGKTKHFQTLFWTSDVRLVDCPGLVMPSFVPMDMQVLSGVLPISQIAAVPFCVHQLARLLPLERILELTHPSLSLVPESVTSATATVISMSDRDSRRPVSKPAAIDLTSVGDKRTWRSGQRPLEQAQAPSRAPLRWTANDIMTAYAKKRGWVTAKAGRPDIHRAGNAILRLVAEGKIPWGFWPPGSSVSGDDGIWLKDGVQRHTWDEVSEDSDSEEELLSDEENTDVSATDEEEDEDEVLFRGANLGRFEVLRVDD